MVKNVDERRLAEIADCELPDHLGTRPEKRHLWEAPTAWLLGTKLITSLRDIALTAVFHFEPRDWMNAGDPIDLRGAVRAGDEHEQAGCWIDYLADSGDSPRLVWQLAYLLQQRSLKVYVDEGAQERLLAHAPDGAVRELPRGAALVMGGDTAYPIATRRRLLERMRAPFIWARQDLQGTAVDPALDPPVTLLGIPGNHDYYNALSGYERQFHDRAADQGAVPLCERVALPGYKLVQKASYFALLLPYDWQFWALDIEVDRIDGLQAAYFRNAAHAQGGSGRNRIIATSRPMFVYHGLNEQAAELEASLQDLDLALPFARDGELDDAQLRLDLSGDVHVYERYWGTDQRVDTTHGDPAGQPPGGGRAARSWDVQGRDQAGNEVAPQPPTRERRNYASVVSGLGGAFHHPSQVRLGGNTPRAPRNAWPDCADSAMAIGERLIHPRKVFQAGAAGVIGLVVAALCYGLLVLLQPKANLLDAPLGLARDGEAVRHCLITLSILATIAALIGVIALGVKLGKKLAGPISAMDPRPSLRWWARNTRRISHHETVYLGLRWLGGNRRTLWGVLITLPAWGLVIAICSAVIAALVYCPHLQEMRDGFGAEYVVILLLIGSMAALGATVGGRHGGVPGRIVAGIFGLLIGVLIVWTPHAWTLLVTSEHWPWALGFLAYTPVRWTLLGERFFSLSTRWRRAAAVTVFAGLVALYAGLPYVALAAREPSDLLTQPPAWGIGFAMIFGAYLTCLWLGWYFFLCLQWNGHGNEAGSAARVVSFAEFLRIKLTQDRAEVWVIAAEGPTSPRRPWWQRWRPEDLSEHPPRARLVDHFVVERAPGAAAPR